MPPIWLDLPLVDFGWHRQSWHYQFGCFSACAPRRLIRTRWTTKRTHMVFGCLWCQTIPREIIGQTKPSSFCSTSRKKSGTSTSPIPNSWMVFNRKSYQNGWLGVPLWLRKPPLLRLTSDPGSAPAHLAELHGAAASVAARPARLDQHGRPAASGWAFPGVDREGRPADPVMGGGPARHGGTQKSMLYNGNSHLKKSKLGWWLGVALF